MVNDSSNLPDSILMTKLDVLNIHSAKIENCRLSSNEEKRSLTNI